MKTQRVTQDKWLRVVIKGTPQGSRLRKMNTESSHSPPLISEEWRARFDEAMAKFVPFEKNPSLAVACSGGADSAALVFLLQEWALRHGAKLVALIVDHGLRHEAAKEAIATQSLLSQAGIPSDILIHHPEDGEQKNKGNLQEYARKQRYRLLCDWCRKAGIIHLFMGHQRDDGVETFFDHLGRGSGVDGLSLIRAERFLPECRILRPLLAFGREEIRTFLMVANISFIEDPSNQNDAFLRTRLRRFVKSIKSYDLPPQRISLAMQHLKNASILLEDQMNLFMARHLRFDAAGYVETSWEALLMLRKEEATRFLGALTAHLSGKIFRPRYRLLCQALESMHEKNDFCVAGCRIQIRKGRVFFFRHHHVFTRTSLMGKNTVRWDGRYDIDFLKNLEDIQIGALGKKGVAQAFQRGWKDALSPLPHPARLALPALWKEGEVQQLVLDHPFLVEEGSLIKKIAFNPDFRIGFTLPPCSFRKKS